MSNLHCFRSDEYMSRTVLTGQFNLATRSDKSFLPGVRDNIVVCMRFRHRWDGLGVYLGWRTTSNHLIVYKYEEVTENEIHKMIPPFSNDSFMPEKKIECIGSDPSSCFYKEQLEIEGITRDHIPTYEKWVERAVLKIHHPFRSLLENNDLDRGHEDGYIYNHTGVRYV